MGCASSKTSTKKNTEDHGVLDQPKVKNQEQKNSSQPAGELIDISHLKTDEDRVSYLWSADLNKRLRSLEPDQLDLLLKNQYNQHNLLKVETLKAVYDKLQLKKSTMLVNMGDKGKVCAGLMELVISSTQDALSYAVLLREPLLAHQKNLIYDLILVYVKTYQIITSIFDPSLTNNQRWWQSQREQQNLNEFESQVMQIIAKNKFPTKKMTEMAQQYLLQLANHSIQQAMHRSAPANNISETSHQKSQSEEQKQNHKQPGEQVKDQYIQIQQESQKYLNNLYQTSNQKLEDQMFDDEEIDEEFTNGIEIHQARKVETYNNVFQFKLK